MTPETKRERERERIRNHAQIESNESEYALLWNKTRNRIELNWISSSLFYPCLFALNQTPGVGYPKKKNDQIKSTNRISELTNINFGSLFFAKKRFMRNVHSKRVSIVVCSIPSVLIFFSLFNLQFNSINNNQEVILLFNNNNNKKNLLNVFIA